MDKEVAPTGISPCESKPSRIELRNRRPNDNGETSPDAGQSDRSLYSVICAEPLPGSFSEPPNLMILGASGHVAQAFLQRLANQRSQYGRLVFLDQDDRLLSNSYLDHGSLDYKFLRRSLTLPDDDAYYRCLLRRHGIDIVLDLTDLDTLPLLGATDAAGVSYVNTALNDSNRGVAEVLAQINPGRERKCRAPHIVSSGMNPGVVNTWVWHGYCHYGIPEAIVHFEYDTSAPQTGWRPMITWSRKEFLTETVWEPTGWVEAGQLRLLPAPSLQYREQMRSILEPVMRQRSYPRGLLVLHEENLVLGRKLGASSKYIYALHPKTMDYLTTVWQERGRVDVSDLEIGDNTSTPLTGSDTIGVLLEYQTERVYYVHSLANNAVSGSNATCAQVAVGVDAALAALRSGSLSPRVHFPTDLYHTVYSEMIFKNLEVSHFVFEKQARTLTLKRHIANLRPRSAQDDLQAAELKIG